MLTAQVVLPTPPFMLINEMTWAFGMMQLDKLRGRPGCYRAMVPHAEPHFRHRRDDCQRVFNSKQLEETAEEARGE
jgi:hypothetical protein